MSFFGFDAHLPSGDFVDESGEFSKLDEILEYKYQEANQELNDENDELNTDTFGAEEKYSEDFDFSAGNRLFESTWEESGKKKILTDKGFREVNNETVANFENSGFTSTRDKDRLQEDSIRTVSNETPKFKSAPSPWGGIIPPDENQEKTWMPSSSYQSNEEHFILPQAQKSTHPQSQTVLTQRPQYGGSVTSLEEIEAHLLRSNRIHQQQSAQNARNIYLEEFNRTHRPPPVPQAQVLSLAEVEASLMRQTILQQQQLEFAKQQQLLSQAQRMQPPLATQQQQRAMLLLEQQRQLQFLHQRQLSQLSALRPPVSPIQQMQQFQQMQQMQQQSVAVSPLTPPSQLENRSLQSQNNQPNQIQQQRHHQRNDVHNQNRRADHGFNGYVEEFYEHSPGRDQYDGLMTPHEKDLIARIQISQLVSDNPYIDDFYYQIYTSGKSKNLQMKKGNLVKSITAKMERLIENRKKERPKGTHLALEGALGKISLNSVKHPRQMLNVSKEYVKEKEQAGRHKKISRRKVLASIERLYATVLELEDFERQEKDAGEINTTEDNKAKLEKLWVDLGVTENVPFGETHPFAAILSVGKGKKIVPRIIRFLSADQILFLVTTVLARLDGLDVCSETLSNEEMELFMNNVAPPIVGFISEVPLNIVNACTRILFERHNLIWLAKIRIGLIFLTLLLSRAEVLKQSMEPDPEDLNIWNDLYGYLFGGLVGKFGWLFGVEGADEVYLWQFLAAVAVGAGMEHQRILVSELREKMIETAKKNDPKAIANVNLFLNALGLGIDASQLAGL